jgi:hypothetical protein
MVISVTNIITSRFPYFLTPLEGEEYITVMWGSYNMNNCVHKSATYLAEKSMGCILSLHMGTVM